MKKATNNKIKLGIFVSVTALLFIAGIYFIGQKQQLFNDTFRISGIFKDISGLEVGNNVRFSGINVGVVEDIEQMTDSTVKVDMMIDESSRKFMKKNVKAIIGSDGLMGNKIVLIMPGAASKEQLVDNDIIKTAQTVSTDEILQKIKVTTDNAATITSDLATVMGSIRDGKGTVGRLLMDTTLAKNVNDAMVNIKQGAGGFKENMAAASHNFLLKGYFKKKEKKAQDKAEEKEKKEKDEKEKK
ncbi:MAG TPA: MlaD family protein [Bacteroidia bacterium]|nr:MlaD family protein [Bacteroidia bacterium]